MTKKKRNWTIAGILSFIILLSTAIIAAENIASKVVDTGKKPLVKLICRTHDSLSKGQDAAILDGALQSVKAVAYTRTLLNNPEMKNIAESNWHADSILYMRGRNSR